MLPMQKSKEASFTNEGSFLTAHIAYQKIFFDLGKSHS